jgi:hypothetical protein
MQDLLQKFKEHISKMISNKLGNKISDYLEKFQLDQTHNFDEIEHDIKLLISNYLSNCSNADFNEISNSLYNNYIEYDDNNLINSIKFFIRKYSKYEDQKLKKLFYRWRIATKKLRGNTIINLNSLPSHRMSNDSLVIDNNITSFIKSPRVTSPILPANHVNSPLLSYGSDYNSNRGNSIDQFISSDKFINDGVIYQYNNYQKNSDIFERLYNDAVQKQDEKILNYELKRLSELESCTFQPNVYKRK